MKDSGLLELLVTPGERHNVVMRAAALQRIISGKSYRQIGEELWLSSQTISGVKKALDRKSYRSYHERGKKEQERKEKKKIQQYPSCSAQAEAAARQTSAHKIRNTLSALLTALLLS